MQALKQGDVQAVVLEDDVLHLLDWLAMLQMRAGDHVPVIVVGDGYGVGMAEALANGATDYAEHCGCVGPLLARLQARVGQAPPAQANQLMTVGPFELHPASSTVLHEGMEISLTAREFALAWVLFSNAGRVVGMSSLAARVWGRSTEVCKRTLEQHIYRLRRKLSINSLDSPVRIQAVYSIGYRLDLRRESRPDWPVSDFGVLPCPSSDPLPRTRDQDLEDSRYEGATSIFPDSGG
ncbi:DNA-binding response OmpR family regulator [Hydrogenophaga palleronii]|uniref:DNA-binding response OmpR family regulator n=1 Tax=Hydrogenophaga palleronii TaxID=65655 RepID=A0ABU1WKW3_9BURK|nr:response regulator transcription factor [Hydrogenophaga palleronii]MDR7149940.1 DNA-binding response OmpR family regulator [Hydrogenophaga palleronii]